MVNRLITTLKNRNAVLYGFGLVCLVGSGICLVLAGITTTQVLGINAFIKPAKFFVSVWIFCWTMGWYTGLLSQRRNVVVYSWVVVATMTVELGIIAGQGARGKLSHFNVSSAFDGMLFALMGIAITLFILWTAYIGILFFSLKSTSIRPAYLWGIRLGVLLFVVFAFEGFIIIGNLGHTVGGAADGGPGLAVTNWSTTHGDLRVAHFFGMHGLQLIPLFGYYVARRPWPVVLLATGYFLFVTLLLAQALAGKPLLTGFIG